MMPRAFLRFSLVRPACFWPDQRAGCRALSYSRPQLEENDSQRPSIARPWYVVEAERQSAQVEENRNIKMPDIPADSPQLLESVAAYAAKDMGLKDVLVIDRREQSESASGAYSPSFNIIGTGTSSRHLQSAGLQLVTWLKKEFHIYADKEGILTTNFVRLHNKRQRRKQQRQRFSSGENLETLQRVGSWIVIDTKIDNIYVHLMTQERRDEVDLEHLHEESNSADIESGDNSETVRTDFVTPKTEQRASIFGTFTGRRNIHTDTKRIPDTREELALQNLVAECNPDLTEDSTEVKELVLHFPRIPTRADWKYRLRFFAVATTQSANFSLRRLVEEAEAQQASGFVLDDEDVETVVSSVCYHAQNHFSHLPRNAETQASWAQLCDYKAALLTRFFEFALQPVSRSLVYDPRLLILLYRTFVNPSKDSISPGQALASPQSVPSAKLDMFFDRKRAVPLRLLLEEKPELMDLQTVGMVLASLANSASFDAFWKVVNIVTVTSGSDKELTSAVTEIALTLVVKSGERDQIVYGIQTFLPSMVLKKGIDLSPTLIAAMESALAKVSTGPQDGFSAIRLLLEKYQRKELQLE